MKTNKELREYLKLKFHGILARDKWNKEDVEDVMDYFDQALEAKEEEVAKDICVIIDKIESQSETNTLEEWKQYKHIRNAIGDKYLSSLKKGEKTK